MLIFGSYANLITAFSGLFPIPVTFFLMYALYYNVSLLLISTTTYNKYSYLLFSIFLVIEILMMPYNFLSGLLFGFIELPVGLLMFCLSYGYELIFTTS